ncbi:MAG: recombinase, partial [Sphingomonas sp.]|nr:recombinase [Sphingomonas sp.]
GWEQRLAQAHAFAKTFARDIQKLEKQIDALLERIVEATNPTVINAYETKIAKLEREKLVLEEKRLTSGNPRGRFEDMFELAMRFLSNPSKLWVSGSHAHRRLVLKLTFADRLSYCRKSGFRTPEMTLPFKALVSFREGENVMAEREGFEPSIRF